MTGLVNRRAFEERLELALAVARAEQVEYALCYLDLDQFKVINDSCGHVAGDEFLRQLSRVLQESSKRDTLARLGGDEFGVLLELSGGSAKRVAYAVLDAVDNFVSHGTAAAFAWASASVWCRSIRTVKALRASCALLTPPATPQRSRPQPNPCLQPSRSGAGAAHSHRLDRPDQLQPGTWAFPIVLSAHRRTGTGFAEREVFRSIAAHGRP